MLAIVIPYYKIKYFEATLQSLASQSDKRFKVYIGDDCSPENPHGIIEKFKEELAITYKKFEANLGSISLTKQWQRCLDLVQTEQWILLLGDDDVLENNVVEAFYQSVADVQQHDAKVIRFATQKIDQNGNSISAVYHHPEVEKSTAFLVRLYRGESRSSLSEYIFNKQVLFQKGIVNFPMAWHSDVVLVLSLSNFQEVITINNAVVKVRITQESISGSVQYSIEKRNADARFGVYLIQHLNRFEKNESDFLIERMESKYLNNKKAFWFGISIFCYYLINLKFGKAITFITKFFK